MAFCPHGHDIAESGRDVGGYCRECRRARSREYHHANRGRVLAAGRARYERLKAAGVCPRCAKDITVTETYCFTCAGKHDEHSLMRSIG